MIARSYMSPVAGPLFPADSILAPPSGHVTVDKIVPAVSTRTLYTLSDVKDEVHQSYRYKDSEVQYVAGFEDPYSTRHNGSNDMHIAYPFGSRSSRMTVDFVSNTVWINKANTISNPYLVTGTDTADVENILTAMDGTEEYLLIDMEYVRSDTIVDEDDITE